MNFSGEFVGCWESVVEVDSIFDVVFEFIGSVWEGVFWCCCHDVVFGFVHLFLCVAVSSCAEEVGFHEYVENCVEGHLHGVCWSWLGCGSFCGSFGVCVVGSLVVVTVWVLGVNVVVWGHNSAMLYDWGYCFLFSLLCVV